MKRICVWKRKSGCSFGQHHPAGIASLRRVHADSVDAAGATLAKLVFAIPDNLMRAGGFAAGFNPAQQLPPQVVYGKAYLSRLLQGVGDESAWIEGIGVNVEQGCLIRNLGRRGASLRGVFDVDRAVKAAGAVQISALQPIAVAAGLEQLLIGERVTLAFGTVGSGDEGADQAGFIQHRLLGPQDIETTKAGLRTCNPTEQHLILRVGSHSEGAELHRSGLQLFPGYGYIVDGKTGVVTAAADPARSCPQLNNGLVIAFRGKL